MSPRRRLSPALTLLVVLTASCMVDSTKAFVAQFSSLVRQAITTIPKSTTKTSTRRKNPNDNKQDTNSRLYVSADETTAPSPQFEYALLFDCDGVILETEELHRVAYNAAFANFDLAIDGEPVVWSVEYYDELQNSVGGGKPKMFHYFRTTMGGKFPTRPKNGQRVAPADTPEAQQALVDMIQDWKTAHYKTLLETAAVARPGVVRLLDEALQDPTIAVGVCSAATKEAAAKTLDITLGPERVAQLNVCILGDDVAAKKPDPLIYHTAAARLGVPPEKCVVVEDSLIGLQAAKGAGMKCIITYTSSTASVDFYGNGADAKMPDLDSAGVTLEDIFGPLRKHGLDAELMIGKKDPVENTVS